MGRSRISRPPPASQTDSDSALAFIFSVGIRASVMDAGAAVRRQLLARLARDRERQGCAATVYSVIARRSDVRP